MASNVKLDIFIDDNFAEKFEVRTIPLDYARRLPNGEFYELFDDFVSKGKLYSREDISLESLYGKFPLNLLNLYDTEELNNPRIRFIGSGIPMSNAGTPPTGMSVIDFGKGSKYAHEMARTIETVARTGCPIFQHVMIHMTVVTYHRLLLPVSDDGRRITRVLGANAFPTRFREDLV